MATPNEVMKVLAILTAAYPNFQLKKETLDVYAEMLADLDIEILSAVAKQTIAESKFFPTVAELREKTHEIQNKIHPALDAASAWQQVCAAIRFNERGVGYWQSRESCDATAIDAAERYGLTRIAIRETENNATDYAQFRDIYNILAKRKESSLKELPATSKLIRVLAAGMSINARLGDGKHGPTKESES